MEPLQVGDPETIDGWRLVGRLWSGGSIAAYMATKGLLSAELQVLRLDTPTSHLMEDSFGAEVERVAALGGGRIWRGHHRLRSLSLVLAVAHCPFFHRGF